MAFPTGATDVLRAEQLAQVDQALAGLKDLAVDVEADAMHAYKARLCFVQLGTTSDIFLLDTLVPEVKVSALAAHFANPAITKFFHAAGGDLQYLAEAGVRVKGLFDTHRAATLLNWPKVGLADLVLERLQVKLLKEHQQSDFSLRPMPAGMRDYIADDVRYLVEVGRQVKQACIDADILEEVELDCARMCDEAAERPDPLTEFRPKIPKQGLSYNQMKLAEAIAFELHALRLKWAEAADVPMGRMLSNAAVGAIAASPPADARELAKREGVRGAFVREHGEQVLELIRGMIVQHREGKLPERESADRGERDPARKKRETALMDFRKEKAAERKVTGSVILPNMLVDQLSRTPPASVEELGKVPYFGAKRLSLYGTQLVELLRK